MNEVKLSVNIKKLIRQYEDIITQSLSETPEEDVILQEVIQELKNVLRSANLF